jgi:hypothetical protein
MINDGTPRLLSDGKVTEAERWRRVGRPLPSLHGAFTRSRSGICTLDLFRQDIDGVRDLLIAHARPILVVGWLDYVIEGGGGKAERDLATLAHVHKVAHRAFEDGDVIVIERANLERLLAEIWHWNFHCWDAADAFSTALLKRQIGGIKKAWQDDARPSLRHLPGARIFVDCHDDSMLSVEAHGEALIHALFTRAVERLVDVVIERRGARPADFGRVAPLPMSFVEYIATELPEFALSVSERQAKPHRVRLDYTGTAGNGEDARRRGSLDYDARTGFWRHHFGAPG